MRETARTAEIALEALDMAIRRQRPAPGLIRHADRGIQHACEPCRKVLAAAGITPALLHGTPEGRASPFPAAVSRRVV